MDVICFLIYYYVLIMLTSWIHNIEILYGNCNKVFCYSYCREIKYFLTFIVQRHKCCIILLLNRKVSFVLTAEVKYCCFTIKNLDGDVMYIFAEYCMLKMICHFKMSQYMLWEDVFRFEMFKTMNDKYIECIKW